VCTPASTPRAQVDSIYLVTTGRSRLSNVICLLLHCHPPHDKCASPAWTGSTAGDGWRFKVPPDFGNEVPRHHERQVRHLAVSAFGAVLKGP
jgi:hypothetical protein